MEFHEKLQELRKSRNLTQEELAEELYVSRTAISKWESGRGYPSIDSLKAISGFFSISIDELLSADALVSIAEKENRSNIQRICDVLFGTVDLIGILLALLPLYSRQMDNSVIAVNLWNFKPENNWNGKSIYIILGIILVSLYCVGWIIFWKEDSVRKSLYLSILPSLLFIESAVVCGNLQLLIFAVLFAPCHILISYMNAIMK